MSRRKSGTIRASSKETWEENRIEISKEINEINNHIIRT